MCNFIEIKDELINLDLIQFIIKDGEESLRFVGPRQLVFIYNLGPKRDAIYDAIKLGYPKQVAGVDT